MLTADGVVVRFGVTTALSGASLSVEEGEAVALVGPSGAGKSTLLLCLAGLVRPQAGRVVLDGRDLGTLSGEALAAVRLNDLGFVFQGGDLMPELTLTQNVELPLRLAGMPLGEARPLAGALLARLGVGDAAGRVPAEVSGGQVQRAAVARAVITSPRVVLADEPTGALDSVNAAAVMDVLLEATRAVGASLVLVTHDRSLAAKADRVVEVRDGLAHAVVDGLATVDQIPATDDALPGRPE